MFCPSCGFRNPEGERYCRSCGTALPKLPAANSTRLSSEGMEVETSSDPLGDRKAAAPHGPATGMMAAAPVPMTSKSPSVPPRSQDEVFDPDAADSDQLARRSFDKGRRRIADAEGALKAMLGEDTIDRAGGVASSTPNVPLRPGTIKLVVEQGKLLGEQYLLNDNTMLIGRFDAGSGVCPDIDLTAQDPAFVHRRHARLQFEAEDKSLHLIDLGGRNGSFVNNQAVPKNTAVRMRVGDKLRIGRVVMRLMAAPEMNDLDA